MGGVSPEKKGGPSRFDRICWLLMATVLVLFPVAIGVWSEGTIFFQSFHFSRGTSALLGLTFFPLWIILFRNLMKSRRELDASEEVMPAD